MSKANPNLRKAENTRLALDKFGKYLVTESRKNLTRKKKNVSGSLYRSLSYELTTGPSSIGFDFLMNEYGEWVDKGRKAGKFPPFQNILDWVKARRFQFRELEGKNKGKFKSYEETARAVWFKIKNKGIKPTDFYSRPFNLGFQKLPVELQEAYGLDVESFLEFTINELNKKYK
jgi:hypothetical protein